jgi:hypothetical protein
MFRASSCSSPRAHQLQQQQLPVHRRHVVVAVLLAVVGPVMGISKPETCWVVSRRQTINLYLIATSSRLIRLNAWGCTNLQTLHPYKYDQQIIKKSFSLINIVWTYLKFADLEIQTCSSWESTGLVAMTHIPVIDLWWCELNVITKWFQDTIM